MSFHAPRNSIAGIVNITPAASAVPAAAPIIPMFTSSIVPFSGFSSAKAITAPGIAADTVIPAYSPKYAFADPSMIASIAPMSIAFSVSSGMFVSAGMKDLKFSLEDIFYHSIDSIIIIHFNINLQIYKLIVIIYNILL